MTHFGDHAVANSNTACTIAKLDDITGGFHAGRERQLGLELILAGHHQYVGKIDAGGTEHHPHLACSEWPRSNSLLLLVFGWFKFAADNSPRHQAAFFFLANASRTSGSRSLPKYMSVVSRKMVGEPKPPRFITSSVLALSWSLMACWPMPAKNLCSSTPARLQTSARTASCEISLSSPQYISNTA